MIEREGGCLEGLQWRLVDPPPLREAVARLLRLGFRRFDCSGLIVLYAPEGHKVLLVPATGRVQIRLDVETPPERRAEVAQVLARWIVEG